MTKEKFEILTARDHVRMRTGMYLGSTSVEGIDRFIMGKWTRARYVPALVKMIDEIIDNAIDEAIRTNFKYANVISVKIKGREATIEDNGRGIPHDEILDTQSGDMILRPEAAWTRVNAGTSFDDERMTIGANGVGSACVNFMSQKFVGRTVLTNGNAITVNSKNGALITDVQQGKEDKGERGTRVSFVPDWSLLEVDNWDEYDTIAIVEDRLNSLQIAFPEIRFKFNNKFVSANTIRKYARLFTDEEASSVCIQEGNVNFFFAGSDDGARVNGYINGVNTRQGGTYVDWILDNVVNEMITMIKRRFKVEVGKPTIKNGLTFVLFARGFTNPKYDSQTKERLTNTVGEVKSHWEENKVPDFKNIAQKIMGCNDIIDPIVEAQLAKKLAAEKRAATLAQKKLRKVKVAKHIPASSDDATLFLCEGDSAIGPFIKVRDPKMAGGFPLRGVVRNTWDLAPKKVLENKELSELIAVLGLDINNPDSVDTMHYKHIATLADADMDGNHISALLLAFFYKFWPRLFTEQRVHMTRTPIMISTKAKQVKWFYSNTDAKAFKATNSGWNHRYIKGLASLTEDEYDIIINQPKLSTIEIDIPEWFEVMMGAESGPRKDWLRRQTPEVILNAK